MVDKSAIEWAEILCANHLQRNPLHAGISITMRVLHPDWARSLRDQCQDAGVAFFSSFSAPRVRHPVAIHQARAACRALPREV
jgi:hypothetical protein